MGWTSAWGLTLTHSAVPHTYGAMPNTERPTVLVGCQKITSKLASMWARKPTKRGDTDWCFNLENKRRVSVWPPNIQKSHFFFFFFFWRAHRRRRRNRELKHGERRRRRRRTRGTSSRSQTLQRPVFCGTNEFLITLTPVLWLRGGGPPLIAAPLSRKTRVKVWRAELRH